MKSNPKSTWLYGVNPVIEALRSGREIKALHVRSGRRGGDAKLREEAKSRGIPLKTEDAGFFEGRFPKGHQGVAASGDVGVKTISLEELIAESNQFISAPPDQQEKILERRRLLAIEFLNEYPFTVGKQFPFAERGPDGFYHLKNQKAEIPLLFTLKATK